MLVVVILDPDGEADRGVALLEERHLIPAAPHAIGAPDLADLQAACVLRSKVSDPARKVARGRVVLAAEAGLRGAQPVGEVGARAFGEDAQDLRLTIAVAPAGIADDVVVEHGLDGEALRRGPIREDLPAMETLLLARKQRVDDGGGVFGAAQHPRRLDHQRSARAVVIGAGGVGGRIHHVGDAAVDMALHDHDLVRAFAAALDRDRIAHQRRHGHARAGDGLAHGEHFEAPAALRADPAEFLKAPIDRRTNPACRVGLRGQGVARAEAHELGDVFLQPFGGDVVGRVGLGGERGCGERGEQQGTFQHAPCLPAPIGRCKPSKRAPPECAQRPVRR